MKTKNLLTIAVMAFVALNFTSCKDDEFDLSFEKCVSQVDAIKIKDGDTICKRSINLKMPVYTNNKSVEGRSLIKVGTSKENMSVVGATSIELEPFAVYYVEATPYIVHGNDTTFGDTQEIKFYSIPKHDLALTADYGDGEIAANIHWKLQYYYEDEDIVHLDYIERKYYEYNNAVSSVSVNMITDYDTLYNKNTMKFPANVDSCYIAQGGTRERPDYPAYIYRYWKDGKTIMRYDPVIYDFCFDVAVLVGESTVSAKDTIRGILMDKQNCVCDYKFNIYRTAKIGNKVWTIDDYRGAYYYYGFYDESQGIVCNFYGCEEHLYNMFNVRSDRKYIVGYHIANTDDWNDLLSFYGITESVELLPEITFVDGVDKTCNMLEKEDIKLADFFTKNGSWQELISSIGWVDDDGNLIDTYQGAFNAKPLGMDEDKYKGKIAVYYVEGLAPYGIVISNKFGISKCRVSNLGYCFSARFVKD